MLEYAESKRYKGDRDGARAMVRDASRIARQADSPELTAECALQLSPNFQSIEVGTYDALLVRDLDAALAQIPHNNKILRARLLARLSQALQWAEDPERSEQLVHDALLLARESGDEIALSAALSAKAETLHAPGRIEERVEVLRELGQIYRDAGSIEKILVQKTRMITALLELGDIAQFEAENEACRQLAVETGLPQFLWYPESMDAMRELMAGKIESTSNALSDRFSEITKRCHDVNVAQGYAVQELFRLIELDRIGEALSTVHPLSMANSAVRSWSAGVMWIQWDSGEIEEARDSLRKFNSAQLSALFREAGAGVGIATLSEVAAHIGAREQVSEIFDRIRPFSDQCAIAGYGVLYFGSFARYCGLLAGALGLSDEAITFFEMAIQHEAQRGAPAWRAYAEIDLALAIHKNCPHSDQAKTLFDRVSETSAALGIPRLERRLEDSFRIYNGTAVAR
jgi:tetratricopeptide (TPR) repeat protein